MAATSKISSSSRLISRLRGFTTYSANSSRPFPIVSLSTTPSRTIASTATSKKKKQRRKLTEEVAKKSSSAAALVKEKRRTRSSKEFDKEAIQRYGDNPSHIPVMLAEVLDVFSSSCWRPLRSFVDCTLGAAGHSSAVSVCFSNLPHCLDDLFAMN